MVLNAKFEVEFGRAVSLEFFKHDDRGVMSERLKETGKGDWYLL